jgi:hypothetical protein
MVIMASYFKVLMQADVDTIKIHMTGSKEFSQRIVDLIFKALIDDEIQMKKTSGNHGLTFESSLEPSKEIKW